MYFVYVLRSLKNGKLYKGQTNDLEDRLHRHFSGQSISTKSLLPLVLIFVQVCDTRSEAVLLEKFLKTGIGREFIKNILT
jgi:putative endonuclease